MEINNHLHRVRIFLTTFHNPRSECEKKEVLGSGTKPTCNELKLLAKTGNKCHY